MESLCSLSGGSNFGAIGAMVQYGVSLLGNDATQEEADPRKGGRGGM